MMLSRNLGVFVVGGLLLSGCGSNLWPSLTGEEPSASAPSAEKMAIPPSQAEQSGARPAAMAQSTSTASAQTAMFVFGTYQTTNQFGVILGQEII